MVANLSRFSQAARLDMQAWAGATPVDVLGGAEFPAIGQEPYVLPMSQHAYFWLKLRAPADVVPDGRRALPEVRVEAQTCLVGLCRDPEALHAMLFDHVREAQARIGGDKKPRAIRLRDVAPVTRKPEAALALLELALESGPPDLRPALLALVWDEEAARLEERNPEALIARMVSGRGGETRQGAVFDGLYDEGVRRALLDVIVHRKRKKGGLGELIGRPGAWVRPVAEVCARRPSGLRVAESRKAAVLYDDTLYLKFYAQVGEGMHPEAELLRYLGEEQGFANAPAFAGALEFDLGRGKPVTVATLQSFVRVERDGWDFTIEAVKRFLDFAAPLAASGAPAPEARGPLFSRGRELPEPLREGVDAYYLEMTRILAERVGELHLAFAAGRGPGFAPEPFSELYQRSLHQSMRNLARKTLASLAKALPTLPNGEHAWARRLLDMEARLLTYLRGVYENRVPILKMRIHGDLHLKSALHTGKDFILVDFEGESERSLDDKRLKRSPLRDVASLLFSLRHAAWYAFSRREETPTGWPETLAPWLDCWIDAVGGEFLAAYLERIRGVAIAPPAPEALRALLGRFLVERAFIQLDRNLSRGRRKVDIPIATIVRCVEGA